MGAKITGLEDLDDDLRHAIEEAVPEARKVLAKACLEIKKKARHIIEANAHRGYLPHYPKTITYETTVDGTTVSGEIGPLIGGPHMQAGLGSFIEYGTIYNAPIPHLNPALDDEEGVFYQYMDELGEKLLEGKSVEGAPVVDSEA